MLRIQEVCKEKGINMQTLASRLGVSYQALYSSVSGNPTLTRLTEIANALEVDVIDLFENKGTSIRCPRCGTKLKLVEE